MNRRQLLSLAFTAPFAVPALSKAVSATPYLLKKSTWSNESFIAPFTSVLNVNLYNAGIAENNIHIGFPLQQEIYPSRSLHLGIHDLGLGAETPEKIELEISALEIVDMFKAISDDALGDVDWGNALSAAQSFQDAMNQMTTTAFGALVPLVSPVLGTIEMYKAVYAAGGKHAKKLLAPLKKKKGFKAPDLDRDGIPDDLPDIFGAYLKESLGPNTSIADGVEAFISFAADGKSLKIDTQLKLGGEVSSGRLVLEG